MMMRGILQRGGAISLPKDTEQKFLIEDDVVNSNVKVSQSWLSSSSTKNNCMSEMNHEYTVSLKMGFELTSDSSSDSPRLLNVLNELEEVKELIPPLKQGNGGQQSSAPPRSEMLAPRTSRMHSENTMTINALSDLVPS